MANEIQQRMKDFWQQKSDEELINASERLSAFSQELEEIVRAELRRRRMPEPAPIVRPEPMVRTVKVEQGNGHAALGSGVKRTNPMNTVSSLMNDRKTLGIIIAIIGVALIVISPNLFWQKTYASFDWRNPGIRTETLDLRGITLFFGVALLVVGVVISAVGFSQSTSTQAASAPTAQPIVTQSVSPKNVELGHTPDHVQSVMGQPDKIINLGTRVIHVYKDMKIIYVDGKVSDVQLS